VPVARLRELYPQVNISLHQGSPDQVARMLMDDTAEIGMATESLADYEDLVTLPCYEWQYTLVVAPDHPLARKTLCTSRTSPKSRSSLITHRLRGEPAFTWHLRNKLHPRIALRPLTPM
jgi:LysR family cys regulon transcriptional activator